MSAQKTNIRDRLLSDENIFLAIYLVNSYVQTKELLTLTEQKELVKLKQIFNLEYITEKIHEIRERLRRVLDDKNDFFQTSVYFKPKKYEAGGTVFRPIHTAALIDQMAMVSMLQVLIYDFNSNGKPLPSELSRMLPSNFYGNIVSYDGSSLFVPWKTQYPKYTAQANELLAQYSKTKEFSYEVNLDLENFFPSINPQVLYRFICGKLPLHWRDDPCILTILNKLLIFKLCELDETEINWYLRPEGTGPTACCGYAKGLPQGLPHTYFFANLFMLLVQKEFEKVFPGRMLFYVDDSIIFTNGPDGSLDESAFRGCIHMLNQNIRAVEKQISAARDYNLSVPEDYCYTAEDFGVTVHNEVKSSFSAIPDAETNSGEIYLHGLSREASNVNFDLYTAFSENEIHMMLSRVQSILAVISAEIERIGEDKNQKPYLEKLLRYQKFFKYRKTILSYRDEGNIQQLYQTVLEDITLRENREKIPEFYEKYTDDILSVAIQFTFKRCVEEHADIRPLIDAVNELSKFICDTHTNHSYIEKMYEIYLKDALEYWPDDLYQALIPNLFKRFHMLFGQKDMVKWEEFGRLLEKGEVELFNYLGYSTLYAYSKYVRGGSNTLTRMLLNAVYSYIFEYDLDDRFIFARHSRNPIEYAQVRVLAVLRNPHFSFDDFTAKYAGNYAQDEFHCTVDYSLLQVLEIFKTFVCKIDWIDQLILTHKYCCDTWKNGSKYLHFYTLHNQEHAVTLIRCSIEWLHAISYFKLKQIDYFILFAACYLHDISMVSLPHTEKFYTEKNPTTDQIYTNLELQLASGKTKNKKRALYEAYEQIDGFFERDVRNRHAADSAEEIRKFPELDFLDAGVREFIARISEAHGQDAVDVYSVKSIGRKSLINEKFVKILLRLSDLSDMSRYRISNVVLNHNLTNLDEVSRFHWISHLITDGCHVSVKHSLAPRTSGSPSFLCQGTIIENLELTVDILVSQTTPVKCRQCKHVLTGSYKSAKTSDDIDNIVIVCNQGSRCAASQCTFLCKWFTIKNEYLLKELAALKAYLNSISDNFFASEAKINMRIIANKDIPIDLFDYLRDYIDHCQ